MRGAPPRVGGGLARLWAGARRGAALLLALAELGGCLWALRRGRARPAAPVTVDTGRDTGFGTRHGGAGQWTVHTDGSVEACGGTGGAGAFYGEGDDRNWAESLGTSCPDSNRAELAAVYLVLCRAPRNEAVTILTDSLYVLRRVRAVLNEGGLRGGGLPDTTLSATAAALFLRTAPTRLRKVKGHGPSSANAAADGLAALGRTRATLGAPPCAVPGLTAGTLSAAVRAQWAHFLLPPAATTRRGEGTGGGDRRAP